MDEKLAVMCASWLREKFGRNGTVIELKLEEQEEIDRLLNLVVVKFGFVDEDGNVGEGAAFLDVDSVRRVLEMGTQRVGAVA